MPHWNRLIFPVTARIARIDTVNTTYDDTLAEPTTLSSNIFDQAGTVQREETIVEIPVQVLDEDFERLQNLTTGDSPESFLDLTAHRRDLAARGMILPDGSPALGKQDRLISILDKQGEVQLTASGLYLHEIRPRSFGLSLRRPRRNLFFLHFRSRERSARR